VTDRQNSTEYCIHTQQCGTKYKYELTFHLHEVEADNALITHAFC